MTFSFYVFFCSILKQHAVIKSNNGEIAIEPASPGAKTKVNGMPLTGERVLKHYDRILFGKNYDKHKLCCVIVIDHKTVLRLLLSHVLVRPRQQPGSELVSGTLFSIEQKKH